MEFVGGNKCDGVVVTEKQKDFSTNKLMSFLLGTIQPQSKLKLLRGQTDILRIIWVYACSEWWSLHIYNYTYPVIRGIHHESVQLTGKRESSANRIVDLRDYKPFERISFMDCPAAIIATGVSFPPPVDRTGDTPLCVNMMPFNLWDPTATLPAYLHGYIPLIEQCQSFQKPADDDDDEIVQIAYLTVDERPVNGGESQRRGGVHVESPGALRSREIADKSQYAPDVSFYHHWGMGSVDGEYLYGGIYLASNMANTTAIWNSRIHDTFGDIIAPHGSLERCREVLGAPTKLLDAGELVWISDRTPHESLPVTTALSDPPRQFFRLVVGTISFWFAEHNTANPLYAVPSEVTIVSGNKFELTKSVPIVWECGSEAEMKAAGDIAKFRDWLSKRNCAYLADLLIAEGIDAPRKLLRMGQHKLVRFLLERVDENRISENAVYYTASALFSLS